MKKIFLFLLVIFLIGGGLYFLFTKTGQNTEQPVSIADNASENKEISKIVNDFYNNYDSCMRNPPAEAAGKVGEYCQNNSGMTTDAFAANLEKGGTAKAGADPIYCAQNPPESIAVDPDIKIKDLNAFSYVNEKMGPTQIKIQVKLTKNSDRWKINNIICPIP